MAAYMEMTQGTPTSTRKFTYSGWIKLMSPNASADEETIFSIGASGDSYYNGFRFKSTAKLHINFDSTGAGGGSTCELVTTANYRDPTAWYHIVLACDTEQVSSGDRLRLYVNGEEVTVFDTEVQPALNHDLGFLASGDKIVLGRQVSGSSQYFNGVMSHVQYVDGLQLAPTEFGEVDSTSGIWKIKTGAYATPGNNGFFLKMEDRTNLDLDSSSNAHTFTTGGTPTATYDNPSNNFCISTPIVSNSNTPGKATLSNGCLTQSIGGSGQTNWGYPASIGVTKGKWYMEYEMGSTAANVRLGIIDDGTLSVGDPDSPNGNTTIRGPGLATADYGNSWGYYSADGNFYYNASGSAYGSSFTTAGDIIGCAFDADTGKLYFSKNGTWQNSGDPAAGSNPMVTITIEDGVSYFFHCTGYSNDNWDLNFGNGYFGTTLITSPEADDAGEGAFKYDVPAGFYALCTNNIATYG